MKNYGDPVGGTTAYVAIVGTLIFILTVIFLEAFFYKAEIDEHELKVVEWSEVSGKPSQIQQIRARQKRKLEGYTVEASFMDGQGRVAIPIEEAMKLLVQGARAADDQEEGAIESNDSASEHQLADADDTTNEGGESTP